MLKNFTYFAKILFPLSDDKEKNVITDFDANMATAFGRKPPLEPVTNTHSTAIMFSFANFRECILGHSF
jgi:hypothetical protein